MPIFLNQVLKVSGSGAAPEAMAFALTRPNPFFNFFLISEDNIGIFKKYQVFFVVLFLKTPIWNFV